MSEPRRLIERDSDSDELHPIGFDQSRSTYESLANTLPLSLLIKDRQGYRVFANQAYLDFRGKRLDELLGKRDEDLFPPEIAKQFTADDQRVMESGQVDTGRRGNDRRGWTTTLDRTDQMPDF